MTNAISIIKQVINNKKLLKLMKEEKYQKSFRLKTYPTQYIRLQQILIQSF